MNLRRKTPVTIVLFMILLLSFIFSPVVNAYSFPLDPVTFTLITALTVLVVIAAAIIGILVYRRYKRKPVPPIQDQMTGAEYCPTCGRPLHIISEPMPETETPEPVKETEEEWIEPPAETKPIQETITTPEPTEQAVAAEKPEPQMVEVEPASSEPALREVTPSIACPKCGAPTSEEDELCVYCGAPVNIMSVPIIKIEGIGEFYSEKLSEIGIETSKDLLENGKTPKGRSELAEKTDISPKLILEWVNRADLIRIKGVSEEYSDLLEASGVDTVVELSKRNPENLQKKMIEVNNEKNLVRRPPTINQVTDWVEQAKKMPRIIEY